ncbi:tyrosine-type recombinase/integrase [Ruegeria sp. HKCCE4150]|uniref:tyrosine-type recombinase/integrase n=1 Tax=Ruegeria sp. HKCCE4150 TaxID=2794828 RepID=UPI001FD7ABB9|nr:site-specific integrase [Ruegeria sp. HKCCE4150]
MPKIVRNQLTFQRVKNEKRPGRYADGRGLYLIVSDHGSRWWQWRGTVNGRRREIGMGSVYTLSLADAREKAAEWHQIARSGSDPAEHRDRQRGEIVSFEEASRQVWADQVDGVARNDKHRKQWISSLETYAFPTIGNRPIAIVTQSDFLGVLSAIWIQKPETARRVKQRMKAVMDWARASGFCEGVNPLEGIEKALPKQRQRTKHFSAVPWQELPELMRRIEDVEGVGALALRFLILTCARSGEVRGAIWSEIDVDAGVWTIPEERMKAGRAHRVPLSPAAMALVDAMPKVDDFVFASRKKGRPLSDMTLSAVLRRMKVDATVHGFRSSFRDWAEEATSFPHEVKEAALAHAVRNKVEAAYRRTDLFEKRREMMVDWNSFLTKGEF